MTDIARTIVIDIRMAFASGIGTYIRNVLPRLFILRPRDHFHLIGYDADQSHLDWTKYPNVSFRSARSPIYSLSQQWEIPMLVPNNADLFWIPHYDIPIFCRAPMLVTVHDVAHLALTDLYKGAKRFYARTMFAALRRKANFIICVSEFSRQEMIRLTGCGIDNSAVVHEGVDDFWFSPPTARNITDRPYLVFVGNVKPHKNLRGLLAAFGRIKDKIPHDLVIIGRREGFITADNALQKMAEHFKDRVRFTGFIDNETLKTTIASADMLLLPSLYEGFGLPPLEAMACGCPTLVSNTSSLPEICADGSLYCDPYSPDDMAQAMLRLINEPNLRTELRQKGKARAHSLRWETCTQKTEEIIQKCLERTTK